LKVEQIAILTSRGELAFMRGAKWDKNIFISVQRLLYSILLSLKKKTFKDISRTRKEKIQEK